MSTIFAVVLMCGAAGAAESEFCLTKVVPPQGNNCSGDDRSAAYFSWSTEQDGTVSVTLTGLPGNTATAFRGGSGMNAADLKVAGKAGVTFTGAFTDAAKTTIIFTPSEPLVEGDVLTYNALVEYKTANAPEGGFALQDLWPTLSFTHTFGKLCVPPDPVALSTPANIAVSSAGTLTFAADANAGSHTLVVYRGESVLPEHIQTVSSGDFIRFDRPGVYTLTVQSFSTSLGYLNSDVSARYGWTIEGEAPAVEVGETVFCSFRYKNGNDAHDALFTWETIDGNIIIKIAPVEESFAPTKFRGNGMSEAFTVNGWSGSWFTRTINDEKTEITLTPMPGVALMPGDTIGYVGIVEYLTAANGNLYPTVDFAALGVGAYIYGSRCPQAEMLSAPVVTGIDANGVITFTEVENAERYALKVYRVASELTDYSAGNITSGSAIDFRTPGEYTVTVQAIGNQLMFLSSEPSERFAWTLENESYTPPAVSASQFCNFALDPAPADYGNNDRAVFSWETRDGNLVVKIAADEGNFDTYFRNDGMSPSALKVNEQSGAEWFSVATDAAKSEVIFTPNIPLRTGDRITYSGIVEYKTGKAVDAQGESVGLWPSVDFGAYGSYLYGSDCAYAPAVVTDKKQLAFSPDTGVATFTLSAINLTAPLVIAAPQGLSVNPDTIRPGNGGSIPTTPVEVRWEEGSSAGGVVQITGGGLAFAKEISVNATGFSEYCNKVLNFWGEFGYFPTYLSVSKAEDSKLSFVLSPLYGETAVWNDNSIQAEKVSVSRTGVAVVDRTLNGNEITLTFSSPLQAGDVVSIGPNPAFVWTAQNENGVHYYNCYIDALQTYTVGTSCELAVLHPAEKAAVQSVGYTPASLEGGQATLLVADGTYAVANIRFWEASGKLPYREVEASADNIYEISGLEPYNTYSINVAAVDEKGYASEYKTLTIKNLGTLTANDFPFEATVTYDGLPHEVSFSAPERAGEVVAVLYNSSPEPPVAVGEYVVTIDVLEGEGYHPAYQLNIGTLRIVKGGTGKHLLSYSIAPHTYDGEPHPVEVSVKPDVEGAGAVAVVKYNGAQEPPVNAGYYLVTVDVGAGNNFDETLNLFLDTLWIFRAATTVEALEWQVEDAVYSGLPHAARVSPAVGVVGLGEITVRYNGATEALNAGKYAISADVAQGENYEAAPEILLDSLTIGKATLTAEHFDFPATMPYDGTPRRLPVTLAAPYTGIGEITVKYDGAEVAPTEIGVYAVSVSATEGSNFLATAEDIALGSFSVVIAYSVTVQINDGSGYRMISPSFTVTLTGDVSNSAPTVSGQVIFENVPRHSAFTVNAAAADYPEDYTVSTSHVGALLGDTTIVLVAMETRPEYTGVTADLNVSPLSAYVVGGVLRLSPAVESVKVVTTAGVVALNAVANKKSFSLAHLPAGVYFVLLHGEGKAKTVKVIAY
ncbi:MAG: T9SS type A sorting domain-containing protein [Prevotellaceae bacterium]|nr:T9SS type A sorting domain-containing protein [Prevotellaceae bacterium]